MYHNSQNLIIHPLPIRFGNKSHILYETKLPIRDLNDEQSPDEVLERNKAVFNHKLNGTQEEWEDDEEISFERKRRYIASASSRKVPHVLHVETAIFVDKDLFRHMAKNYPKNTEGNLIRFVMAMINGVCGEKISKIASSFFCSVAYFSFVEQVQLLYHHPSLGHQINFILKRLEILYNDPKELRRSSDIDIFLNSFCMWQRKFNPVADDNIFHFDHAVILTGTLSPEHEQFSIFS